MTTDCQNCQTNNSIYRLDSLCCCARFVATLPTRASMANTARKLSEKHGHSIEDLRREVSKILKRQAEAHAATVASR